MNLNISALKTEAVSAFETLVPTYKFTLHSPKDYYAHLHQRSDFKSQEDKVDLFETTRKTPH